jgi:hypothetical protein
MCSLIERLRPDVVVFDNAGRTSQLEAARRIGARLVYISARPRQRRKAFRLGWMRKLDEHWIAYPEFIAGSTSGLERLKLAWLKRPRLRFLDCLLPAITAQESAAVFARTRTGPGQYVLVVPGGGTGHPGAGNATAVFLAAARGMAAAGIATIFIAPSASQMAAPGDNPLCLDLLPSGELIALIRGAKALLTNGGGTLIQAIACQVPSISVAIASDQPARIASCVAQGFTRTVPMVAAGMIEAMNRLLADAPACERMRCSARAMSLRDATHTAVDALDELLPR